MYKIMIVDDEPIERDALKLLIKNRFTNLTIAGEAQNGFEAIENSKRIKPDIIIMDIKMPGLSGIDAIRQIKQSQRDVKFLILSSYNEFAYAHQALKLGAEDFIVKPAKMQVLVDSINSIIAKIEDERCKISGESVLHDKIENIKPLLEREIVDSLLLGADNDGIKTIQEFLDVDISKAFCVVLCGKNINSLVLAMVKKSLANIGVACLGAIVNGRIILFLPFRDTDQEQYSFEISKYIGNMLYNNHVDGILIGTGESYTDYEGLQASYFEAMETIQSEQAAYKDTHTHHMDESPIKISIYEWERKFFNELLLGNEARIIAMADEFLGQAFLMCKEDLKLSKDKIYQVVLLLDKNFEQIFSTKDRSFALTSILEEINDVDMNGLRFWLIDRMKKYASAMNSGRSLNRVNVIVQNAVSYIEKHYSENITLENVSEKLNISTFYLSKILKKYTEKNYTDILSETRIAKAKELLIETDLSIKEITYMTGFNSQNYFARIFRKHVGLTPTEFKVKYYASHTEDSI